MDPLFPIGSVCRLFGITPDTLRHYEKKGLLTPVTDPHSRYRYYTPDHLDRIEGILHARAMGIPYPGGVEMDRIAEEGDPNAYKLPHPHVEGAPLDFSFSGLKTAVLNLLNNARQKGEEISVPDLCASYRKAVVSCLTENFFKAAEMTGAKTLAAAGGVSANRLLRRELVPLYQALLADGSLKLDVVAYGDPEGAEAARQAFPESVRQYHRRFKLGGYKMFLDGSPQGRTAWLRRPYQGEQEYRGYGTLTDAEVLDMVRRAGTDGMQLLAHCNGDAACAQYLAALDAAAREGVDLAALRPVMIHAQLLGRDQLPEVRRLGVIPSFFVAHVYHWGDVHLENLGPGRAEAISPAGSAAEQGIPFTFHQDAPVIRPDMLETVWCAVNRVTRQGRVLGREERVDVRTALEAVTVHAAYQYFEETDKGTLAPGKQADLVILDRDPLAVPQEELRDIRVLETWKDGVPIFCREA